MPTRLLLAFGLSGFAAVSYEILWLRLLSIPPADEVAANRQAIRSMIHAFLEREGGRRTAALQVATGAARSALAYDVPALVLVQLAWEAQERHPDQAAAGFEQALRDRPRDADALTGLGTALLRVGRTGEATAAFRRALRARPAWPEALEGLRAAGAAPADAGDTRVGGAR